MFELCEAHPIFPHSYPAYSRFLFVVQPIRTRIGAHYDGTVDHRFHAKTSLEPYLDLTAFDSISRYWAQVYLDQNVIVFYIYVTSYG